MDLFPIVFVKKRRPLRKKIEDIFLLIIVLSLLFAILMFAVSFVISCFSSKLGLMALITSFASMGLMVLFLILRMLYDFTESGF